MKFSKKKYRRNEVQLHSSFREYVSEEFIREYFPEIHDVPQKSFAVGVLGTEGTIFV